MVGIGFNHIPKTGGSSLQNLIKAERFPYCLEGKTPEEILNYLRTNVNISYHWLDEYYLNGNEYEFLIHRPTVTLLRNPIRRWESIWNYQFNHDIPPTYLTDLSRGGKQAREVYPDINSWIDDMLDELNILTLNAQSAQVTYVRLSKEIDLDGVMEIVESLNRYIAIGVTEKLDEMEMFLRLLLGINEGCLAKANTSSRKDRVSPTIAEKIRERCSLDYQLWQFFYNHGVYCFD